MNQWATCAEVLCFLIRGHYERTAFVGIFPKETCKDVSSSRSLQAHGFGFFGSKSNWLHAKVIQPDKKQDYFFNVSTCMPDPGTDRFKHGWWVKGRKKDIFLTHFSSDRKWQALRSIYDAKFCTDSLISLNRCQPSSVYAPEACRELIFELFCRI